MITDNGDGNNIGNIFVTFPDLSAKIEGGGVSFGDFVLPQKIGLFVPMPGLQSRYICYSLQLQT